MKKQRDREKYLVSRGLINSKVKIWRGWRKSEKSTGEESEKEKEGKTLTNFSWEKKRKIMYKEKEKSKKEAGQVGLEVW